MNRRSSSVLKFLLSTALITFGLYPLQAQTVAYVLTDNVNRPGSSISVLDTGTNTVTATIPVGNRPFPLIASADGTHLYVGNELDNNIFVIDTLNNTVIAAIRTAGQPSTMAFTPDGTHLYVASGGSSLGGIQVIDTVTNSVVGRTIAEGISPSGIAITPSGAFVYVIDRVTGNLLMIDTTTNTVVGNPVVANKHAGSMVVTPDGTFLYSANEDNSVTVIATATNTIVATISLENMLQIPTSMAITRDGKKLYISGFSGGQGVVIIDTATNTARTPFALGFTNLGIALTRDDTLLYVTNSDTGTVSAVATATDGIVGSPIQIGQFPSVIVLATISVPFAHFEVEKLDIDGDGFKEQGEFTLAPKSTMIDPVHQPVTLTIGKFSLTIPAESFHRQKGDDLRFFFEGMIQHVRLKVRIAADDESSFNFRYNVNAEDVHLSREPTSVIVGLKIGTQSGTASVKTENPSDDDN